MLAKGSDGSLRSGDYFALTVDDHPAAELSATYRKIPTRFVSSVGLESREVRFLYNFNNKIDYLLLHFETEQVVVSYFSFHYFYQNYPMALPNFAS